MWSWKFDFIKRSRNSDELQKRFGRPLFTRSKSLLRVQLGSRTIVLYKRLLDAAAKNGRRGGKSLPRAYFVQVLRHHFLSSPLLDFGGLRIF